MKTKSLPLQNAKHSAFILWMLFTLAVLLLIPTLSFSKGTDIGLQLGPTLTKSIGRNNVNSHVDIGAAAEFFVRYNFTPLVSIRTGIGFEDKGDRYNGLNYTNGNGDVVLASVLHHRTKYITIPLLVELTFAQGKKVQPYINTGVYMGFLISARDIYKDNTNGNVFKSTVTNSYHTFDMGYVLGVGLKVPIKTHWLFDFGVRNDFGFIKTNKNSNAYVNKLLNYSTAFNFGFAYRFGSE